MVGKVSPAVASRSARSSFVFAAVSLADGAAQKSGCRVDLHRINCAGQGCEEREGCRRYRMRLPEQGQKAVQFERLRYQWASFDVERAVFGDCPQFVRFRDG